MIERTKRWINHQLSLGEFTTRQSVIRRSVTMAVRIAALAYGMNICAHLVLEWTGLLPYDLLPALVIATALTPAVSLIVAFAAYYVVGMAVYELSISRDEYQRMSRQDSLTGLLNRRAFLEVYDGVQNRSAFVLFDIDRFKSVNDTYGHSVGDDVIVTVARALSSIFGSPHHVGRFGGEEFVVLLLGLSEKECLSLVEQARVTIAGLTLAGGPSSVTVSAGINCAVSRDFRSDFAAADNALYLAKISGRNRVVSAGEGLPSMPAAAMRPQPGDLTERWFGMG